MKVRLRDTTLGVAGIVLVVLGVVAASEGSWPGYAAGCGTGLAIAFLLLTRSTR